MLEGYKAVASQIYQEYGIEAPELSGYEASNNQNTGNRQDIPTVLTLISPIALVILLLILRLVSHGRGFPFFWFFGGPRGPRGGGGNDTFGGGFSGGIGGGGFGGGGGFSGGGGSFGGAAAPEDFKSALKKRNMGCCKAFCNSHVSFLTPGAPPAVNLPYRQKCYRHSSYFRWGHAVGTIPVQKTD